MVETQMAMTPNFVWIATEDTESDYLEYRQWTEEPIIKADDDRGMEFFAYTLFRGYHGYTIACRSKKIYDIYRVFQNGEILAESEDEVFELPECDPENLVVRAYEKLSDNRLLRIGEGSEVDLPARVKSDSYKLSVVVPLYKAETFMCRTIDAILSSSLDSIQLILVNDGSPDNSYEIAKRYEENYSCVIALTKPNSGASESRNLGISMATGEYSAFCDSDDIPHPYMYEKLYQTCKKQGTDIAIGSVLIKNLPGGIQERFMRIGKDVVYTYEEMMRMRETSENIFFVAEWNKIIKTDIARIKPSPTEYAGKRFPYEDIAYTGMIYSYIDKFAYCNDAIYTRDKRKRKTEGTISTRDNGETIHYMREARLFASTYPLIHKSGKNLEWHDYRHTKRVIKAYMKILGDKYLEDYRNNKLREVIYTQHLLDNKLIMGDSELRPFINKIITGQ